VHALFHPLRVRVHDGEAPIAQVLRLIEDGAAPGTLPQVLESLCRQVGAILDAPVVSIYVRARPPAEDALVMQATVGLPASAVGRVCLRVGEGITGFAAECLRPVSVDAGPHHARYKPVPHIGEEAFPCYLAVPLVQGGQALGVMVLQRPAGRPFETGQVLLATALAAPFAHALDLASSRERTLGTAARDVVLLGRMGTPGLAWGAARIFPTLGGLLEGRALQGGVEEALETVTRRLARSARRVARGMEGHHALALGGLLPLLNDQRLRSHVVRACEQEGVGPGLHAVAKAYARVPYRTGAPDPTSAEWLANRAQDVEDLCLLVAARMAGVHVLRAGEVLVAGARLGGLMALAAAEHRASAVVVAGGADADSLSAGILSAAGIPSVVGVGGVLEWARPGDTLLVDTQAAHVRVNPPSSALARVRAGA
jgi:phosphotransferase system, enzyme I, PtsP